MRINVREHPKLQAIVRHVYFDGVDVRNDCVEAKDGDDGYVVVLLREPDGRIRFDYANNEAASDRRCGRVEIVLPDPVPDWIPMGELKAAGVSA